VIKLKPDAPTVLRYLGDAYWELDRLEDAAGMYRILATAL